MNLYKISQNVNNDWDTYDAAIVCAENEKEARLIHPDENYEELKELCSTWVGISEVDSIRVEFIGVAYPTIPKGVVLASFNAG